MPEATLNSMSGVLMMDTLPSYYWEDPVTKDYLQVAGIEMDMLFQLYRQIFDNAFALQITELTIELWEDLYAIPHNPASTIEVRRARVLSYISRHHRIRRIDIAAVAREFLSGAKAYVLQGYTDVKQIRVSSLVGFTIGSLVYIGSETSVIVDIDFANSQLILSAAVSPYAYAIVSEQRVDIYEQYADYTFNMVVDETAITDEQSLIDAIEAAKPAHIGWRLYGQTGNMGIYNDITSLLNSLLSTGGVRLIYENIG